MKRMRSAGGAFPRRHVALFLIAVTLPCVVVVALGLRLASQEEELAAKHAADERRRALEDIAQQLVVRLERIRTAETGALAAGRSSPESPVTLVAAVHGGQLVRPWERRTSSSSSSPSSPNASGGDRAIELLRKGEDAEVSNPAAAADLFRSAADSGHTALAAYARFVLARALARLGRRAEANAINTALAAMPFEVTDEHGMPLAVYAAQRLMKERVALPPAFLATSRAALSPGKWAAPTTCYAIQEIAAAFRASPDARLRAWSADVDPLVRTRIADAERVAAIEADVLPLLPRSRARDAAVPLWVLSGSPAWLVGAAPSNDGDATLIAVDAAAVLASLPSTAHVQAAHLATPGEGAALGDPFPGLRVAYTSPDQANPAGRIRLQRIFFSSALGMVLSLTLLGGYLLWRDVQREMRVAAMRAQFVASVSHELKTPLTSIRMFAETLRMGRGFDERTRAEYLDTIVSESERLTRLLNNVLDFSRIEQDRKAYRLQRASLADIARAAARALEYPLAQEGFSLDLDVDERTPPVQADSDAIQQAILNLLTNAMKYSGASRRLELAIGRRGDAAVVSVTDHGIGIPPETHARLFDRFYRVPTPENQQIPGTGLGLTIVQHIVQAHGGTIELRSAPGQGSTFSIVLPAADAAQPHALEHPVEAHS